MTDCRIFFFLTQQNIFSLLTIIYVQGMMSIMIEIFLVYFYYQHSALVVIFPINNLIVEYFVIR